jgi:hypothetical protein
MAQQTRKIGETDTSQDSPSASGQPQFHFVRLSHPSAHKRIVFRSVSESRARQFVMNRYPRGSEVYLEKPDGTTESYEHERAGEYGQDADQWQPFDPESYQPPEEVTPPGETAWADKEG